MIDLHEAGQQLVGSLLTQPTPVEGLRRLVDRRRRRRRRRAIGGTTLLLVAAAVAVGLARDDDGTAVVTAPSTTTSIAASDPAALAACQASVPVPPDVPGAPHITVVAAYTTTVGEVDAWLEQPGGPTTAGSRFPGLAAGDTVSLCFEDGPFHPPTLPGEPAAEVNRAVSAIHGGTEVQLEIGPIDRIPIERPHPPTTRILEVAARNGPLSVAIPRSWHVADRSLTPNLHDPTEAFTVASMPIGPDVEDARCAQLPVAAIASLGDDDVVLSVQEWSAVSNAGQYAAVIPPPGVEGKDESLECLPHPPDARTWLFSVRLGLRAVLVYAAAGPDAGGARLAELWRAVESLSPGSPTGA